MYMVMFVLHDPDQLDAVLDAWCQLGVSGVTIIESSGIYRRRAQQQRIPLHFLFESLADHTEAGNYTLFTLVESEERARQCAEAVEAVVGDLHEPNTGVLAAWPLAFLRGVPKRGAE